MPTDQTPATAQGYGTATSNSQNIAPYAPSQYYQGAPSTKDPTDTGHAGPQNLGFAAPVLPDSWLNPPAPTPGTVNPDGSIVGGGTTPAPTSTPSTPAPVSNPGPQGGTAPSGPLYYTANPADFINNPYANYFQTGQPNNQSVQGGAGGGGQSAIGNFLANPEPGSSLGNLFAGTPPTSAGSPNIAFGGSPAQPGATSPPAQTGMLPSGYGPGSVTGLNPDGTPAGNQPPPTPTGWDTFNSSTQALGSFADGLGLGNVVSALQGSL